MVVQRNQVRRRSAAQANPPLPAGHTGDAAESLGTAPTPHPAEGRAEEGRGPRAWLGSGKTMGRKTENGGKDSRPVYSVSQLHNPTERQFLSGTE